jgi:hypothetical protein
MLNEFGSFFVLGNHCERSIFLIILGLQEENGVAQGEDAHESKKRGRHGQKKEKEKKVR